MAKYKFSLNFLGLSLEMYSLMSKRGLCALLGNHDSPTFEVQFLVTIVVLVLALYDTWLIARL